MNWTRIFFYIALPILGQATGRQGYARSCTKWFFFGEVMAQLFVLGMLLFSWRMLHVLLNWPWKGWLDLFVW